MNHTAYQEEDIPDRSKSDRGKSPDRELLNQVKIIGMTLSELEENALEVIVAHTPSYQSGNIYPDRCSLCNYTRSPCEMNDIANAVLQLLQLLGFKN